eukprot:458769_1
MASEFILTITACLCIRGTNSSEIMIGGDLNSIAKNDADHHISIKTWLHENRLQIFNQCIEENLVIISDLLSYDEHLLNGFIEDCGIKGIAYIKRFKDAVRVLQYTYHQQQEASIDPNTVYRVLVSTQEVESIQLLENKLLEINNVIQQNLDETERLLENRKSVDDDIESRFEAIQNWIGEKKRHLKQNLINESEQQLNHLKQQKNILEMYRNQTALATAKQNKLILDPTSTITDRKDNINQIAINTLKNINNEHLKLTVTQIVLELNLNISKELISSFGSVQLIHKINGIKELLSKEYKLLQYKLLQINNEVGKHLNTQQKLNENKEMYYKVIETTFEKLRSVLNTREMLLKDTLLTTYNTQTNRLQQYQSKMNEYKISVMNAQYDLGKQTATNQSANHTVCNVQNDTLLTINIPFHTFLIDQKDAIQYISNIGVVTDRLYPPTISLRMTGIDHESADLKIDCRNTEVIEQLHVKYKNNQDSNWTQMFVSEQEEYKIRHLNVNTTYEIYVRYQAMQGHLWSEYSNHTTFQTTYYPSTYDVIKRINDIPFSEKKEQMPIFAFKPKRVSTGTIYWGCDKFEIVENNQIRIYSPYVYDVDGWAKMCSGNNGDQGPQYIAHIMNWSTVPIPKVLENRYQYMRGNFGISRVVCYSNKVSKPYIGKCNRGQITLMQFVTDKDKVIVLDD